MMQYVHNLLYTVATTNIHDMFLQFNMSHIYTLVWGFFLKSGTIVRPAAAITQISLPPSQV